MTSKKGAIEDTKKSHKYSQTRSRKKVFKLQSFLKLFLEGGKGWAGAIPVAQAAVRRHRATLEGEADFRRRRPRGIVNYDVSAS